MNEEKARKIAGRLGDGFVAMHSGGGVWTVENKTSNGTLILGFAGWGFDEGDGTLLPGDLLT